MELLKTLALVALAIGVAGFGFCTVTSSMFALSGGLFNPLLALALFNAAGTWLCILGVRRLRRKPLPEPLLPPTSVQPDDR